VTSASVFAVLLIMLFGQEQNFGRRARFRIAFEDRVAHRGALRTSCSRVLFSEKRCFTHAPTYLVGVVSRAELYKLNFRESDARESRSRDMLRKVSKSRK
jgi:hypothetical protein